MKILKLMVLLIVIGTVLTGCPGCNEVVPQGYLGMVKTTSGLTGTVLQPGHHSCFGRDQLLLIQMAEVYRSEKLSILCADDLNFKFTIEARFKPRREDKVINKLLRDKGSIMVGDGLFSDVITLPFAALYTTYAQRPLIEIARGVVTKYETTAIRNAREEIKKAIVKKLTKATENSPMELTELVLTNFDYPDEIEAAMKEKKIREIAIDKEKKTQAIKLLKADNRLKIAMKNKVVRAAEAQAEVAYIRIVGAGLNKNFLTLKKIEADKILYEKIGAGDKLIMDAKASGIMINTGK